MTDKAQPFKEKLAAVSFYKEAALQSLRRAEKAEAERDKLRDIARQAICVIDSVQKYEQPRDPTEENALAMCEHEVFDFDVDAARTELGETEND